MNKFATLTASAILATTTSLSAMTEDEFIASVVAQLEGQGYTEISIERSGGLIKFEGENSSGERELVYDLATGTLLLDEVNDEVVGGENPEVVFEEDDDDDEDETDDAEDDEDDSDEDDADDEEEDDDEEDDSDDDDDDDDEDDAEDDSDDDDDDDGEDDDDSASEEASSDAN